MASKTSSPRVAAIVGPYGSGKTTLLEALLVASGSGARKGSVTEGSSVGDASPEARARHMGVEVNIVGADYLGDHWCFLDCPGSIEFQQDSYNALMVADAAILVVEPEPARAVMAAPVLKFLEAHKIPRIVFINKAETAEAKLSETMAALQALSSAKLILRELPIRTGDVVTGYVDLVSERAYRYRAGHPSELVRLPETALAEEKVARQEMLEGLADFDDTLLEELLEDVEPPPAEVYQSLAKDLAGAQVVPVYFGSAAQDHGVKRLLKLLRHEAPGPEVARARLGIKDQGGALARIFKTVHASHTGKMSYARVWRGEFAEGGMIEGVRPSGLFTPQGAQAAKAAKVGEGGVAVLGRLDHVHTGALLGEGRDGGGDWPSSQKPLFSLAVVAEKKQDDVKLTGALTRLVEEDPSLHVENNPETNELVLWGQGEIHLQVALDKLRSRFHLEVTGHRPMVPYKETIRRHATQHGRHKRQSGGHGQFGDVSLEIEPQARGEGFAFVDRIVGGVVPRNYIPAVEEGVVDFLKQGPFGFPVVDVKVTLTDGTYHAVDSSDQAFKTAARLAMTEGMPKCEPVLLEPVLLVQIAVPSDYTSKAQRIISGRRGHILGYEGKEDWAGWDEVSAHLPQAEMGDLIIELRSLTMGVGTFSWQFDHLQEIVGRGADKVVEERKAVLAQAHHAHA